MPSPETQQAITDHNETQRILYAAELIRGGAAIEAGRLVVTHEQVDALAQAQPATEKAKTSSENKSLDTSNPEIIDTKEIARTLVDKGTFLFYTSMEARIDNASTWGGYGVRWDNSVNGHARVDQYNNSSARNFADSLIKYYASPIQESVAVKLVESGIDEVAHVKPLTRQTGQESQPILFGTIQPDSPYRDEQVIAVNYQTIGGYGPEGIRATDSFGRGTAVFRGLLLLPKSLAKQFQGALKKDPTLLREMMDVGVVEKIGVVPEDWQAARQPYGRWREKRGGISRMLLVTGSNQETLQF